MNADPSLKIRWRDRRRLVGCGVVLVILIVLLVLAAYGLGFWGSGEIDNP